MRTKSSRTRLRHFASVDAMHVAWRTSSVMSAFSPNQPPFSILATGSTPWSLTYTSTVPLSTM